MFDALRPLWYRTILVDPPWQFENWSEKGEGKNPSAHYDCMSVNDMARMPVGQLAAADSVMIMWATWPMLPQCLDLMAMWGFTYKTGGVWAKQSSTGNKWAFGPGYIVRSASEPFLIGTIGKPPILSRSQRNLIVAPVREHSRKPEAQYDMAEAIGAEPRLELFSRTNRDGWTSAGNQTGMFEGAPA